MKKLATLFLALMGVNAQAADFTFTGEIQDITCEVNTAFKNLVVILPTVGKVAFANKKTAGHTPFRIELGKCNNLQDFHEGKELYAFFKSEYIDAENDYTLKNVATKNAARNVNIQFTNSDGSAIKVGNTGDNVAEFELISSYTGGDKLSAQKENYTLNYGVQYYKTNNNVSAGLVETFATFTIQYK